MTQILYNSNYNIQQKWINDIAPTFLNVPDVNLLRIGLFGYINEVMSTTTEDNLFLLNTYSNEIFPNKAVLPNSIYNYSALSKFSDFNARPASLEFYLALKKDDLITGSTDNVTYKEFLINRNSRLIINDITFMLDYDIKIVSKYDNGKYIFTVQYVLDPVNPISEITNPYIENVIFTFQGVDFLFMKITVHQVEKTIKNILVQSNDIVNRLNYELLYDGKLADFNVYYKPSYTSTDKILLNKYFIDSFNPETRDFCFYNYPGSQKIGISFSAHPDYFKPEFNSELLIEIYTTLGVSGNFSYTGQDLRFVFYNSENELQYSDISLFSSVLSDSVNGRDSLLLDEIKDHSVKSFSIRDCIVTDTDLTNSFELSQINSTGNSSVPIFIKKRDDIMRRMYSSFILLKNTDGSIIPTNTVDLIVYENQLSNNLLINQNNYFIKPGEYMELLDPENRLYVKPRITRSLSEILLEENMGTLFPSSCPYLMRISKDPYMISYYLTSISENLKLQYSFMNENTMNEFSINSIDIVRNSIVSNRYKISFTLKTTLSSSDIFTGTITETGNLKLFGVIKENTSNLGYIKFSLESYNSTLDTYTYSCYLTTDDNISDENKIKIKNSVYNFHPYNEILKEYIYLPNSNLKLSLQILYNGYVDKEKYTMKNQIPNLENYSLISTLETYNTVELFKNYDNLIHSTLLVKSDTTEGYYFKIKSVPVIRYSYLQNETNYLSIIEENNRFKTLFNDFLENIENNFEIDYKYFNTYGKSKYFTVGKNNDKIDRLNISLDFNIKLSGQLTELLINDITNYIKEFTENINVKNLNYLYISNLMRNLESKFDQIVYTEFKKINLYGTDIQSIENKLVDLSTLSKEEMSQYIPEFLNIHMFSFYKEGILLFKPDIKITWI